MSDAPKFEVQPIRSIATPWAVVDLTEKPHSIVSSHNTRRAADDALLSLNGGRNATPEEIDRLMASSQRGIFLA